MHVAYLVNQYPKVSHSFIRREILALEEQGLRVSRYAVRGWADAVADATDQVEKTKTRYLLQGGLARLGWVTLRSAFASPLLFTKGLALALQMARRADRSLPYHLAYLAEACQLLKWLKNEKVNHIHAHFGTNSAEVAMLAKIMGGPDFSFTVHGPEEYDKPEFLHLTEKIEHARFVVAISSFGKSQLYRWTPSSQWAKIVVVHCGLEASFHQGERPPIPTTQRLVCVGRLCEQKGQLLLLQALKLLLDRGLECELVLAGDGEMRAEIESKASELGLTKHIRITGWIDSAQVRTELLAAKALVLPSFAEGLPVVIMEAMALERPVISTSIAGIPELVAHSETGWLTPAGDLEALASAMANALTVDTEVLQEMGRRARTKVLKRHDINTEAAKLLKLFKNGVQW